MTTRSPDTRPRQAKRIPERTQDNLARILAGIRFAEGGTSEGNYQMRKIERNDEYVGAYGIPQSLWSPWSTFAGVQGAPISSQEAQDKVAASVLQAYYQQYGSWEMAVIAWFAGPQQANNLAAMGGVSALEQRSPITKEYLDLVYQGYQEVPPEFLRHIEPDKFVLSRQGGGNWVMPVAGDYEWSRGSFMDKHTKHSGSHHAIDIYAAEGTPIVSPVSGKVTATGSGGRGGNWVRIMGADGVEYYFAHMAGEAVVEKGQQVRGGYHLGYVGNTGSASSTSPHLHFTMKKDGRAINPSSWLEGSSAFEYAQESTVNGMPASMAADAAVIEESRVAAQGTMMTGWLQNLSRQMAGGDPVIPERVYQEAGATKEDVGLNDAKVMKPLDRDSGLETPDDAQVGEPL